jgi:hypothetical protein
MTRNLALLKAIALKIFSRELVSVLRRSDYARFPRGGPMAGSAEHTHVSSEISTGAKVREFLLKSCEHRSKRVGFCLRRQDPSNDATHLVANCLRSSSMLVLASAVLCARCKLGLGSCKVEIRHAKAHHQPVVLGRELLSRSDDVLRMNRVE